MEESCWTNGRIPKEASNYNSKGKRDVVSQLKIRRNYEKRLRKYVKVKEKIKGEPLSYYNLKLQ